MGALLILILIFFIGYTVLLPWILNFKIHGLAEEIKELKALQKSTTKKLTELEYKIPETVSSDSESKNITPKTASNKINTTSDEPKLSAENLFDETKIEKINLETKAASPDRERDHHEKIAHNQTYDLEKHFGTNLPVWIGAVALILSIFFLVKYSIELGLITPAVRISMGALFGIVSIVFSQYLIKKDQLSNRVRIAQSLCGAGIAALYITTYAATNLFQMIPIQISFVLMVAITSVAISQSLSLGAPIAAIGLFGGFITPALINTGSHNTLGLFAYLYLLFLALNITAEKKNWHLMSLISVFCCYLWAYIWIFSYFIYSDSLILGLFTLLVISTVSTIYRNQSRTDEIVKLYKTITFVGGSILICILGFKADFSITELLLYGLISAAALILARVDMPQYQFAPWLTLAINLITLFSFDSYQINLLNNNALILALLYFTFTLFFQWTGIQNKIWINLNFASTLSFFLLTYFKNNGSSILGTNNSSWTLIAFALFLAYLINTVAIYKSKIIESLKDYIFTSSALACITFLSISATIELEREFLSVVFATQILALSIISSKLAIESLRKIISIALIAFAIILLPQILLLIQISAYSILELKLRLNDSIPIVEWPLFQLGLPAGLFLISSKYLRKQNDNQLVSVLEAASICLIAIMGYYESRHFFHPNENILFSSASFIERGFITNVLFLFSTICLFVGGNLSRDTFYNFGKIILAICLFRIFYFDLLIHNPYYSHQYVGSYYLINGLLLPFGAPILFMIIAIQILKLKYETFYISWLNKFILLFLFCLINFNIRHFFHGAYLDVGRAMNAEIYSYSLAWLLFGLSLLLIGTIKSDKMIRLASQVVIGITITKVFIVDASELSGLLRVVSFMGLGLSLLGLSWFYSKFVFKDE